MCSRTFSPPDHMPEFSLVWQKDCQKSYKRCLVTFMSDTCSLHHISKGKEPKTKNTIIYVTFAIPKQTKVLRNLSYFSNCTANHLDRDNMILGQEGCRDFHIAVQAYSRNKGNSIQPVIKYFIQTVIKSFTQH